jgi:hypothetical protein
MDRTSREEWAKRVERWGDSGLTAKEYAAELGIKAHTRSWWKWRLSSESLAKGKGLHARLRRATTDRAAVTPLIPPPSFTAGAARRRRYAAAEGSPACAGPDGTCANASPCDGSAAA